MYTSQRTEFEIGLYFYQSRFYDANLGRFISADTIVPGGVQGLDRYAYVLNSPVRYTDPSGNKACDLFDEFGNCKDIDPQWQKDKSCAKTVFVGDKVCRLVPVGNWNVSTYNYAIPSDADKLGYGSYIGKKTTIDVCNSSRSACQNVTAPFRFWFGSEGIMMAGTGILPDGRPIHVNSYKGEWQYVMVANKKTGVERSVYDYYDAQEATFTWGYGGPARALRPYIDAAVGPLYFEEDGTGIFFFPDLSGYTSNGGVFYGVDRGGEIDDGEIDIFTGKGVGTQNKYLIGLNSIQAYQIVCDD